MLLKSRIVCVCEMGGAMLYDVILWKDESSDITHETPCTIIRNGESLSSVNKHALGHQLDYHFTGDWDLRAWLQLHE